MPVSNSQYEDAKRAIGRRLDEANNINGAGQLYMAVKNIKPKGFRGSILKAVDWPTSWGVLVGLSPAQISQNRESTLAARAWQSTTPTGTDNPSDSTKLLFWSRLLTGYFAANTEVVPESDFPRWRKPSWMTEADAMMVKDLISSSYQGEAPLEQTMPTEDVPREQRMADLAEQEEAMQVTVPQSTGDDGEGSEPFENESTSGSDVSQFDSLHGLYSAYWRRTYGIESPEQLQSRFEEVAVRKGAIAIFTLEKLGYLYTGITNFLQAMANRGLMVYGVRPGTRNGYEAYCLVDLKGNSPTASRYQSATAYRIMSEACFTRTTNLKSQFDYGSRALQVMRFSGRGGSLGGYQVLSLNYRGGSRTTTTYSEGNSEIRTAREEAQTQVMEMRGVQGQPGNPQENLEPPTPTVEGAQRMFYYIGYQKFPAGQTFRSAAIFNYGIAPMENFTTQYSYAFYFTATEDAVYKLYRVVFNPMAGRFNNLTTLKELWANSGQLSTPETIKVQEVRDLLNRRKLRQMIVQAHDNTNTYDSEARMQPKRSDAPQESVPFNRINLVGAIEPAFTDNLRRLAQQEPAPPSPSQAVNEVLSEDYMKQMGNSGMVANNPFGIEIEGWFAEKAKSDVADLMKRDGIKVKSTRYHGSAPSGYFKLEDDSSVKADGSSYDSRAFEMVSPVLKGEEGKKRLLEMLGQLRKYGAKTTASAGTHIHFPFAALGDGDAGLQGRKQLITNVLVMAPFLKATQVLYSQDRYYARDWTNINAANLRELQTLTSWREVTNFVSRKFEAGRNFLHIKESSRMGEAYGPPTYEFRFPASNFEDDSVYQLVRLLDRIWTVSSKGYVPHSPEMCKPRNAERWLTDLLGVELYSFWRNRIRDVYPTHRYLKSPRDSEYDKFSGQDSPGNWVSELSDNGYTPTAPKTPVPTLNDW